jgi:hypothetical protein
MWINFTSNSPFAIKVYLGSVNAVSGEAAAETADTKLRRQTLISQKKSTQDYVVAPNQLWLDGIASGGGEVKQFVAMPLGEGFTVEAQIKGQEDCGGLQFEITPAVVKPGLVQAFVQPLAGKSFSINIGERATVDQAKYLIRNLLGLPVEQQRLIYKGRQLQDCKYHVPIWLNWTD